MSIIGCTAGELLNRMERGELTSEEIAAAHLDAIAARDGQVKAFLRVNRETALAQARAVDDKRRKGEPVGRLGGLPVAVKDVICAKGEPATCASRMLQNFVPPYDAHVITRLREADAVLI